MDSNVGEKQEKSVSDDNDIDIESVSSESSNKTWAAHQQSEIHMTALLEYLDLLCSAL